MHVNDAVVCHFSDESFPISHGSYILTFLVRIWYHQIFSECCVLISAMWCTVNTADIKPQYGNMIPKLISSFNHIYIFSIFICEDCSNYYMMYVSIHLLFLAKDQGMIPSRSWDRKGKKAKQFQDTWHKRKWGVFDLKK